MKGGHELIAAGLELHIRDGRLRGFIDGVGKQCD